MTLVLTATTSDLTVMVADCLLSTGGRPTDDEVTKLTVVDFSDARLAMGFTGLATLNVLPGRRGSVGPGQFRTVEWLAGLVAECAPPEYGMYQTLTRLCNRMTATFPPPIAGPGPHFLVVVLTGFRYVGDTAIPTMVEISNARWTADRRPVAADEFKMRTVEVPEGDALMLATGAIAGVKPILMDWQDVLKSGTARAAADKGVSLIRRAAKLAAGSGIGDQCQSITFGPDQSVPMTVDHHANRRGHTFFLPHAVDAAGPGCVIYLDASGFGGDVTGPDRDIVFPKVQRNAACPCGSGRKYKICHGGQRPNPKADGYMELGPYRMPVVMADERPISIRAEIRTTGAGGERVTRRLVDLRPRRGETAP